MKSALIVEQYTTYDKVFMPLPLYSSESGAKWGVMAKRKDSAPSGCPKIWCIYLYYNIIVIIY